LALGPKTVPKAFGIIFCPARNCEKAIPTFPKGEVRKPRGRTVGELFRLIVEDKGGKDKIKQTNQNEAISMGTPNICLVVSVKKKLLQNL
tara:strand:+ start:6418 stop:6687 length:270 start_codon:yes stop_codon:yes gene_type:complete